MVETARAGPCAERGLPLSRQAPRPVSARTRNLREEGSAFRRPWMPTKEWGVTGGGKRPPAPAPAATPLSGPAHNILQQCCPDAGEKPERRRAAPLQQRAGGSAWTPAVGPKKAAFNPARYTEPAPPSSFALGFECEAWELRSAQRPLEHRSPLELVDNFLTGQVAPEFLDPKAVRRAAWGLSSDGPRAYLSTHRPPATESMAPAAGSHAKPPATGSPAKPPPAASGSASPEAATAAASRGATASAAAAEARLRGAFDFMDLDGSGAIGKRELYKACEAAGIEKSRAEMLELHQAADKDGSGQIEYSEFKALAKRLPQLADLGVDRLSDSDSD